MVARMHGYVVVSFVELYRQYSIGRKREALMKIGLLKRKRAREVESLRRDAEQLSMMRLPFESPAAKERHDRLMERIQRLPQAEKEEIIKRLKPPSPPPLNPEEAREWRRIGEMLSESHRQRSWLLRVWEGLVIFWWAAVAVGVAASIIFGVFWIIGIIVTNLVGLMGEFVPIGFLQVLVATGAVIVGSGLYRLRCRKPMLYGLVEIALGILFAGYVVNHVLGYAIKEANSYFTIAGALYIIVRGYDNVYRSLKWGSPVLKLMNRLFFGRAVYRKL